MTRSLYAVVNTKVSWNSTVELSEETYTELVFWNQDVDSLNCRSPWLIPCIPANLFNPTRQIMPVDLLSRMKAKFFTTIGHLLKQEKAQHGGSLRL